MINQEIIDKWHEISFNHILCFYTILICFMQLTMQLYDSKVSQALDKSTGDKKSQSSSS